MSAPKILAFAGSAREASWNKMLVRVAAEGAREAGADVTVLDLRDYPLPLFDEDLETTGGEPENAKRLKQIFAAHQGLLISCPEYNSSITPLLKNTIDWLSRAGPGEKGLACITGKTAALMSASPGALGGLRGLVVVRMLLGNIGVTVLPAQVAVAKAREAFDGHGQLRDPKQQESIRGLGAALTGVLRKLTA